ncbi:MAG: hypothetical protein U1F28_06530 [Acinetobacter sp.]
MWDYQCPATTKKPITIVISYINMAGQAFINDDLLWQDQSLVELPQLEYATTGILPVSSLKQAKNILGTCRSVKTQTVSSGPSGQC